MIALVTGGAGFIGSALVDALLADGDTVVCLDALTYAGNRANLPEPSGRFDFVEGDIRDGMLVREVLARHRPDTVFHLAAETHVDRSIDDPVPCIETNVTGTYELLAAVTEYWNTLDDDAKAGFRYLQVSTDEVFGSAAPGAFFTEASRYDPSSPYAASKASADYIVRTWSMAFGLPVLIAHGGNTYGPRQFPEKLIPLMILNGAEGRTLPVYGSGEQVRDWLHVDDHVAGLRAVAARGVPGESYILCARSPRTNLDVMHALCAALDRARPEGAEHARLVEHVADRPGHDARYASDPSKAESTLGWQAGIPFDAGIADTVDWYLANGDWCAETRGRYRRERLGLGQAAQ